MKKSTTSLILALVFGLIALAMMVLGVNPVYAWMVFALFAIAMGNALHHNEMEKEARNIPFGIQRY